MFWEVFSKMQVENCFMWRLHLKTCLDNYVWIVFSVLYFCLCIWAYHFCSYVVERAIHANFSIDTTKEFPFQLFTDQHPNWSQLPIVVFVKKIIEALFQVILEWSESCICKELVQFLLSDCLWRLDPQSSYKLHC